MMKLLTVLGTRPEIIKFSTLLPQFDATFTHTLVHTGQHYDENMDRVFFRELQLREPDSYLKAGTDGGAAAQVGRMLERIEPLIATSAPDMIAVLGDTNSTLVGALAAAKANVPIAHVEAGCRSFNRRMPEEQNRVIVDHLSDLLFAPDSEAVANLTREGLAERGVHLVGNTGLDATRRTMALVGADRLAAFGVAPDAYVLLTIHRAENTNDVDRLRNVIAAVNRIGETLPVLFPVHPRTAAVLARENIALGPGVRTLPPLGNLDFVALLARALFVMSDSGGIQEEAAVVNRPCLVLRDETEWTRLVDAGKNFLVGNDPAVIVAEAERLIDEPAFRKDVAEREAPLQFGATGRIIEILSRRMG